MQLHLKTISHSSPQLNRRQDVLKSSRSGGFESVSYLLHKPQYLISAAPYTSVGECVKQTFKFSGVRGPFQGLFTTMVRNVPANSVYLGSFEVLKKAAGEYKGVPVPELPAGYVLGAAGFGGILYWCAIYPVDVCKSAIMTVSPLQFTSLSYHHSVCTQRLFWSVTGISLMSSTHVYEERLDAGREFCPRKAVYNVLPW